MIEIHRFQIFLNQNHDCRYHLVVEIRIGLKSSIKFGWLGIQMVDDPMPDLLLHQHEAKFGLDVKMEDLLFSINKPKMA